MTLLCALDAVEDFAAKGFEVVLDGEKQSIFVVRRGSKVYAYRNSCPHLRVPLEWNPDRFLSIDRRFIQCSMHGALFRVQDGLCLMGPCEKQSLKPVPVEVYNGEIHLTPETSNSGRSSPKPSNSR
jgi:nitrite reductase/ring-hydroxylating ferredoxin subunit